MAENNQSNAQAAISATANKGAEAVRQSAEAVQQGGRASSEVPAPDRRGECRGGTTRR